MRLSIAVGVVAIALAFVLLWKSPLITRAAYRAGFFVGLSIFSISLFTRSSSIVYLGRNPVAPLAVVPFVLLAAAPYILLIETGIAGYRGFSSWMRYISLLVAISGAVGLVASLLLPRLLRT